MAPHDVQEASRPTPRDSTPAVVGEGALAAALVRELDQEGGGVDGVVAVLVPHRGRPQPEAAASAVDAAVAAGRRRLVLVASSEVYEPSYRHPCLVDETWSPPRPDDLPVARRWRRLERAVARRARRAGVHLTVLRAAPVPLPGGDDPFSRLLTGVLAAVPAGYDPPLQLLALPDLARAVRRAARRDDDGGGTYDTYDTYNVVPAEVVPLRWALRLAGVRRLPLPGAGGELAPYLSHPWTASGVAARRKLGFAARHTGAEAVAALAAGRPAEPPEVGLSFDPFGLSPDYVATYSRTLFRFLHDVWWRVEHRDVDRVPRHGAVVLVGVHRGFQPWDGVMALHLLRREVGRIPRFLIHPSLTKFPFLANYMRKLGGVPANGENADHVLGRQQGVLAVFPEGIRGAFTPYRRAYRLGNFGRRDYVRFALAHSAPLVPFVTVGSAEIYPILGRLDWRWFKRLTDWPYLPVTPTFPLPPWMPLPSKWHTRFLEPEDLSAYGPETADDAAAVAEIGERVESRMQAAIDGMLARRESWWRGSVFR